MQPVGGELGAAGVDTPDGMVTAVAPLELCFPSRVFTADRRESGDMEDEDKKPAPVPASGTKPVEKPVDEAAQEDAAKEREKTGGYQ
jgi:hypothetical protein